VAAIRRDIVEAHVAIGDLAPERGAEARLRYLQAQFAALAIAARRLAGETMPFLAEASAALGLELTDMTANEADIAAAREILERTLPDRGPLGDRYMKFRGMRAVAPDRVLPAFRAAVGACQARVSRHVTLPASESIEIETAHTVDLEASATYAGSFRTRVTLETAGPIDLAHLVWLAAHETYPGHHTQHVLADRDCVQGRGWRERELFPNFGRHHLHTEGAAEAGAELLLDGDAFVDICRELAPVAGVSPQVADEVAVYRAHLVLDGLVPSIARAYLDGELAHDAAIEQLGAAALVPHPAGLLAAIERRRTRLLSYPVGRRLVSSDLMATTPDRRWPRLARWATTLVADA
jgi:hypothetical protein